MVFKFQELEDYDAYDPKPYQGGYDIAASFGAIKPADMKTRSQFGVEPPVAQYGNERNPYKRGHPGPSIYGGRPEPGAVYGGGRDRTQPSKDSAQPDKAPGKNQSSNGKPKPEEEIRKPRAVYDYEVSEESGFRKLKSAYDEEHKPAYNEAESAHREPYYGYGEPYGQSYSEVDQYGYRNPFSGYDDPFYSAGNPFYGYDDAGPYGYRQPQQPTDADSAYGKPYMEEDEAKARLVYGAQETAFGSSDYGYGHGEVTSYGGYGGYGRYGGYGEYSGYGGHWKKLADDDPARFGGGSVYIEEPVQQAPPAAPASASAKPFISWW